MPSASTASCQVLAEDADLAEAVPAAVRAKAILQVRAPLLTLEPGSMPAPEVLVPDVVALLVLRGLLIRRVDLAGRSGSELLGECDLLRPWQHDNVATLPLASSWAVLEPTRLAVIDTSFARHLAEYPQLMARLLERGIRRSRQLVVNMAIVHQARVDERLRLLFWHLAARWGRVRGDGVLLPVRLTHAVLADLVAARRPTVTTALSELARQDVVRVVEEGWLLVGLPPGELPD